MMWKVYYQQAHEHWFESQYPIAYKDGHYCLPKFPDIKTTNGITKVVADFMTWSGHYCNRINVSGRMIGGLTKTLSGNVFDDRKWIKSSTKKGTSDLMTSIYGRMVCIEVKNALTRDRLRADQDKEKLRVEKSGAVYIVITQVDDFFQWYQSFTNKELI